MTLTQSPTFRIVGASYDSICNLISDHVENHADCYLTRDEPPIATFRRFSFSVLLVDCAAIPNLIENGFEFGRWIEWQARRVGQIVDESDAVAWRQRCEFVVEAQ